MIGQTISHYKILEKLGEGGMGVVYKAKDIKLKRVVALKFLPQQALANEESKSRFVQEAQTAGVLVHPNIATIFEFDEVQGQSFIAMEYVEGVTLEHLISSGPLPLSQATEYAIAIADALALAHRKGVIHRDIKPGNIMVSSEGSEQVGRQIKVLDFGLAKFKGLSKITVTGTLVGTLAYMSPEQACGETVDHRTDIFSWGAVFYEMLAGTAPFIGESAAAVIYSVLNEEPVPLSQHRTEISEDLQKIISKALAKNPDQRYQSMTELLTDLAGYQYNPQTLAVKSGSEKKSIAVLPFEDFSLGKQNEYLADGMTEELVMVLSQNQQLRVIARTSIMQYKGQPKDVRNIGRELGVTHVLEGSVRRYNDSLRVTAQLIDAADGSHLWADKFDGVMKDVFAYQERVARQVSSALEVELKKVFRGVAAKPAPHLKAYEYYIESKLLLDAPTLQNLDRAVLTLERALKLDPSYAAAYGCLAITFLSYLDAGLRPAPEYLSKAEEAAQKALAIDKSQPDALYTLANLTLKRGRVEAAFDGFSKVLGTDPNHAHARWWRAILLYNSSFLEEALQEADRLLSADPFSPMAHWLHSTIRLHQGMFDAAVAEYEQVVTELPTKLVWLALVYRYRGSLDKAWESARKLKKIEPDGMLWKMAFAFLRGTEGKGKESLHYIAEQVKEFAWDFLIVTYWIATFYAMAGEKDEAFSWLERSITIGNRNHRWFEIDPHLENLRNDTRFLKLLRIARTEAKKLKAHFDKDISSSHKRSHKTPKTKRFCS